jgi:hypothetical protein
MNSASQQPSNLASEQPSSPPTPLRGWVNSYYRHYKGKKLGPYYVRRWKVNGKIRRQYLKPEDVEKVRAACEVNRDRRKSGPKYRALLDNFRFQWRMILLFDRGKEPRQDQKDYIVRLHQEGMYITGRPLYRPRRFMVPSLSNFVHLLPSREKLDEIARKYGPGAVLKLVRNAYQAHLLSQMLAEFSSPPA